MALLNNGIPLKKKKASSVLKCTLKSMSVCKQSPACETSRHIARNVFNIQKFLQSAIFSSSFTAFLKNKHSKTTTTKVYISI